MMEFVDANPQVKVDPSEYQRLLGYPRDWVLQGRSLELAEWAREWYANHGQPWIYAREAGVEVDDGIRIDGVGFNSARLGRTLREAEAHGVFVVAVSAGEELELESQRLWKEEKPDEYFFLEAYGSAVVEHLATATGARLCAWAEERQMAVLPHYSPGYPEWDIDEQPRLLELIAAPRPITALGSGALRPKKSLLAVFGITRHIEHFSRLADLVPCDRCSFHPCQYRRAPRYAVSAKALRRWAAERLTLARREDGAVEASFRYEGTTCTNMGRPLQFHYRVTLGPREEGYPILEQHCAPAPGDTGHAAMCQYIKDGKSLMAEIDADKPCAGQPLSAVLAWRRPTFAPACYCDASSREHKWGLVLETIHYALAHRDSA